MRKIERENEKIRKAYIKERDEKIKNKIRKILWECIKNDRKKYTDINKIGSITNIENIINKIFKMCKPRKLSNNKIKKITDVNYIFRSYAYTPQFINGLMNAGHNIWED